MDSEAISPTLGLTATQFRAAQMIARGDKKKDVAAAVNRRPQTISRWLRDPDFQRAVTQLHYDEFRPVYDVLRENVPEMVGIVLHIAKEGGEPGVVATRLKAALWVLDKAMKEPKLPKSDETKQDEGLPFGGEELEELLQRGRDFVFGEADDE